MSEKSLKMILILVGVLALGYGATTILGRVTGDGGPSVDGALATALEKVRGLDVQAIRMAGPDGESVALDRTPERWTVNGHAADSAMVERFRSALSEARIARLASTNPDNHARLGVATDDTWRMEIDAGQGEPTTLLVGGTGAGAATVYLRHPDQEETYLVSSDLRTHVRRTVDNWRDRVIVRLDTASVSQVAVTRDEASYTLERGETDWRAGGETVAPDAIQGILAELAHLQAQGFADEEIGEQAPERSVTVFDGEGAVLAEIQLYSSESAIFRTTASGRNAVFELPALRADRLAPSPEQLAPREEEPEPESDPS